MIKLEIFERLVTYRTYSTRFWACLFTLWTNANLSDASMHFSIISMLWKFQKALTTKRWPTSFNIQQKLGIHNLCLWKSLPVIFLTWNYYIWQQTPSYSFTENKANAFANRQPEAVSQISCFLFWDTYCIFSWIYITNKF